MITNMVQFHNVTTKITLCSPLGLKLHEIGSKVCIIIIVLVLITVITVTCAVETGDSKSSSGNHNNSNLLTLLSSNQSKMHLTS